jgi:Arc/MetJ-type ribon-helix-helix transcriptional regulator
VHLQLPPALEARIREAVASGRYRDEIQVVDEALALLEGELALTDDELPPEVLAAIDQGEADIAADRTIAFETIEDLRKHLRSL